MYRYSRYAGSDSLIHYHDTRDASRITYGRNIVFDDYGKGIVGTYDSTRLQLVFAMGDSYKISTNGAATNNMYGIAWSHPNAGGLGGANNLNDHGMLIINNGSFRASISSRIVASEEVRGTLFRDYNDSGFFVNPNGTSIVDIMEFGGDISTNTSNGSKIFGMYIPDGKYQTRNWHGGDGGYVWGGMQYVTGMSDSPIGSYSHRGTGAWDGWRQNGWVPIDRTKTYKVSAWIRTVSGNPYCYLSFTQAAYDYAQPDNGGWGQPYYWSGVAPGTWTEYTMTIGPSGSGAGYTWYGYARFMQLGFLHNYLYGGYSGQAEFIGFKIEEVDNTLAANTSVLGDIYATRFVDSNDGGYYLDPNGVDNQGLRMRGGALHGPNWTWGQYLAVGTNGHWSGGYASVATTDGNLHLDSKSGSGTYLQWYVGGPVYVNNDIQAQIFYDRNNTGYYVDPAGTARLSYVAANGGIRVDGNSHLYLDYNYGQTVVGVYSSYRYQGIFSMGTSWMLPLDGTSPGNLYGLSWSHPNAGGQASYLSDHGLLVMVNGQTYSAISSTIWARSDVRAPIFYDRDNTGYYVDQASTTNLNRLVIQPRNDNYFVGTISNVNNSGDWQSLTNTYGQWTVTQYNYIPSYSNSPGGVYTYGGVMSWRLENHSFQLYAAHTGDLAYKTQWNNDNYSGWRRILDSSSYPYAAAMNQYVNTNSDPTFNSVYLANGNLRLYQGSGTALHIQTAYGNGQIGPQNGSWFHFETDRSNFYFGRNVYANNAFFTYGGSTVMYSGDIRSPIFYDNNNTGYYVDPNGYSQFSAILANDWFRAQSSCGLYTQDYGGHWRASVQASYGTWETFGYARSGWGGINIIDPSGYYNIYMHESGNGGLYQQNGSGWVWYWSRGNSSLGLGGSQTYGGYRAVTNGNHYVMGLLYATNYIESANQMYATIWYDSNNSGFYIDPNGTSNFQTWTSATSTRIGRPTYWTNRYDIYGTINGYQTGTNGWGTGEGNWANAWKGGFSGWDIWGTGTDHPQGGGYIHAQGIVSGQHYASSDGGSGYGWMMVGAGDATANRYWARGKWGGSTSGWLEFVMSGSNPGYTLYSYIMYDANDTGYYIDPNGTSQLSTVYMDGVLWSRNGYGRIFLGGNLHIDSYSHSIYFNYYTNNPMRYFGHSYFYGYDHYDVSTGYANGSYRAPIFYDNNDTGYYLDPNSTSDSALRVRGGTLYGPNPTWGAYLWVGTNGRPNSWASVAATNGNLHLDCQDGYTTYINYYSGNNIYSTNTYGYNYYDRNDSSYYCDPNGYSQLSSGEANNYWRVARLRFTGEGGNSGQGVHAYDLFQEGGGWSYPYPDLRIAFHTGIKMGANSGYEGIRIYDDYPMGTIRYQFNGGSGYQYQYTWTNVTGHHAIYSGTNSAHWYPSNHTYGTWRIDGGRNGYQGISMDYGNTPTMMFDGSGNGGFYYQSGRWMFYHYYPNNCVGVGTSSTSSSYRMYIGGGLYAEGNVVAYSDRRKKENIISVDNALEKLLALRGVYYNRTDDKTKKRNIGVIAQEVEEILPEVVTYASDVDEYGVSYGNFAGLFIEAIKEQQKTINKQSEEIEELKEILNNLILNIKG